MNETEYMMTLKEAKDVANKINLTLFDLLRFEDLMEKIEDYEKKNN